MENLTEESKGTVVFFVMDALGHVHPILSIARELIRRNYRAVIFTMRPLKNARKFETMGIDFVHCQDGDAAEKDGNSEERMKKIMEPLKSKFRLGAIKAYESTYKIDGALDKHLSDMIACHDIIESKLTALKPKLIVYDHVVGTPCATYVAPRWVRLYSGFPSALVSSIDDNFVAGLGLKISEMEKRWKNFEVASKGPLRQKIRKFWLDKGLKDWPLELDLSPTSPYLNFYLGPQELGLEDLAQFKSLPDIWFRLEHTIEEEETQDREFDLPEKFANMPGRLIYFSLGTLVSCDTELINRLLLMFSKSPNKFIVSMGQMHKFIKLYDNMWGQMYVDQHAILKKVDLFITHGGHNSIIEAFYHGVPGLVVLPVFADQFDSAQRIQDCGFGIRLNPFDCTEDALLEAIDSLLANKDLKIRMQKVSSRLKSIRYSKIAVDKLEQLIIGLD